jgi:hypothetical protein
LKSNEEDENPRERLERLQKKLQMVGREISRVNLRLEEKTQKAIALQGLIKESLRRSKQKAK